VDGLPAKAEAEARAAGRAGAPTIEATDAPATAAEPVGEVTPGREGAPISIDKALVGVWGTYGFLKYALVTGGDHEGATLWWDGAAAYKLGDGRVARIAD
jgi:hypothetical protein